MENQATGRAGPRFLASGALCLFFVVPAAAQAPGSQPSCEMGTGSTFSGYRLYEENDSIIQDGGDERYTQGLRLEIGFRPDRTPCWTRTVDGWLKHLWPSGSGRSWQQDFGLVLGQNLYTPRIITT